MATGNYFVPRSDWDQIGLILSTDIDVLHHLGTELAHLEPARAIGTLLDQIHDLKGLDRKVVNNLLEFSQRLLMIAWMQGDSIGSLVMGVADYFDRISQFDAWDREAWLARKDSLEKLLGASGPLYIMAKADALRQQFDSIASQSRVICDARYVFDEDGSSIAGAFVTSTLVIEYFDADYSRKRHFVSFGSEDIDTLIQQLQRARTKATAIVQSFSTNKVKDLTE